MAYTQVGDTCYPSELSANQAIAAGQIGRITQIGTASYVVDSSSQTATGITYVLKNVASTATVTKTATLVPIPCQALTAADAGTMAWLVVASWVGVYALLFLTRVFRGESSESTYGTA
jgi:hypothetical protein